MSLKDYNILGLDLNADNEIVKKTYRKLALKYHPDKNDSEDAKNQFTKISQAYNNIINKPKVNEINKEELFNKLFSNMQMCEVSNIFITPLPAQTTYISKTIEIIDGKITEKITEKKNGVTRTRTIIKDI
jgi:F0F1-type ATP synthase delta subunit